MKLSVEQEVQKPLAGVVMDQDVYVLLQPNVYNETTTQQGDTAVLVQYVNDTFQPLQIASIALRSNSGEDTK